jgi:hypothetical protein
MLGAVAFVALVAAACGGGSKKPASSSGAPFSVTSIPVTTAPSPATLAISPASGPVGTSFSFTASGFRPTENVSFEIDFPNGTTFTGQKHLVPDSGTVEASYATTPAHVPGTYAVKAVGDQGSQGTGQFTLTPAAAHATATTTHKAPSATTTTMHHASTSTTLRHTTTTTSHR